MAQSSATSVTPSAAKPPLTVWLFFIFSWPIGWWMAYDGVHQRVTGDYVRLNGQLGPWASLVSAVGIDPLSLGWIFVILGLGFIAASFGLYLRRRWGYNVGLAASLISLFYLGFGTPMAVVCLIVLLLKPTRAYLATAAAS
mgnify:CR=1 FL=1